MFPAGVTGPWNGLPGRMRSSVSSKAAKMPMIAQAVGVPKKTGRQIDQIAAGPSLASLWPSAEIDPPSAVCVYHIRIAVGGQTRISDKGTSVLRSQRGPTRSSRGARTPDMLEATTDPGGCAVWLMGHVKHVSRGPVNSGEKAAQLATAQLAEPLGGMAISSGRSRP
jgi:hypothetical protein